METPPLSSPTNQPELQILLTTTSGRHIFHYPAAETNSASTSLLTTLAAAFTAFMHTTHSTVTTIQTSQQTLHMISSPPLLLAITTPIDNTLSLTPLARLLLSAVYTATSRSLHDHLLTNPTASTGKVAALVAPLLRNLVTSFSLHPLPVHLSLSPALPSSIDLSKRVVLQNIMRQIVKPQRELTHALLIFKSSHDTGMGEILLEVFREGMQLSWLDHAILSCADEDRLFLPTTGFRRGLRVRRRSLKSESAMRMEIRSAKLGIYALLVLGTWSPDDATPADNALDDLQDMIFDLETLDGMHGAVHHTDPVMDHVRRAATPGYTSLNGAPESDSLEALLILGRTYCIGMRRAYDPLIAMPIAKAVSLARTHGEKVAYVSSGVRVLVEDARYVTVFKDSVPHEEAQNSALQVVKWLKRLEQSLLPLSSGAFIPHNTPLAGFIAPFRN